MLTLLLASLVTAQLPNVIPITCSKLENRQPASINDLQPSDIKIIATIGDSINAGLAAIGDHVLSGSTIGDVFNLEQRGISWPIGGDANALTLANFFKHYNPNVYGASVGSHFMNLCGNGDQFCHHSKSDVFNAAVSGAFNNQLRPQTEWLFDHINTFYQNAKGYDYNSDYKFISLFNGANDICLSCLTPKPLSTIVQDLEKELDYLIGRLTTIPRVIIHLSTVFQISQIWTRTSGVPYCQRMRKLGMGFECKCGFDTNSTTGDVSRDFMDKTNSALNQAIIRVGEKYKNETKFKVVVNRAFEEMDITKFPDAFISNIDCFHPSLRGHEYMAVKSWNNLWGRLDDSNVGVNATNEDGFGINLYCPTSEDRLK